MAEPALERAIDPGDDPLGYGLAGLVVQRLITEPAAWMNRRVEAFELIDDVTVRRRVSLDFTLPPEVVLSRAEQKTVEITTESLPVVPLTILRKRKLRRFDLRDEEGAAVPVLTTSENGLVSWAALCQLAEAVTNRWPRRANGPSGRLRRELRAIATGTPPAAAEALDWLSRNSTGRRLLADTDFNLMARLLENSFVLFAEIGPEPGRRRILKLAYEEPLKYAMPDEPAEQLSPDWKVQLGWSPYPLEISLPAVGTARSFHFELGVPDGLEIVSSSLDVGEQSLTSETFVGRRTHLGLDEPTYGSVGRALVRVRAERQGFLSSALLLGLVTFVLLVVGFIRLDVIATEVEAVGPVLLIVPALLAAFLVRPGEHALASRILAGTRIALTVAGVANVAAAAILVADLDPEVRCVAWWLPLLLSTIGVVVPAGGWLAAGSAQR